jgi:hypothetical protein
MPHAAARVHLALARALAAVDRGTAVGEAPSGASRIRGPRGDARRRPLGSLPPFPRGGRENWPEAPWGTQQTGGRSPPAPR